MIREAIREAIIGGKGKKPRTIHITIHITIPSGKAKRYEREYQAKKVSTHNPTQPAAHHRTPHTVHTAYTGRTPPPTGTPTGTPAHAHTGAHAYAHRRTGTRTGTHGGVQARSG